MVSDSSFFYIICFLFCHKVYSKLNGNARIELAENVSRYETKELIYKNSQFNIMHENDKLKNSSFQESIDLLDNKLRTRTTKEYMNIEMIPNQNKTYDSKDDFKDKSFFKSTVYSVYLFFSLLILFGYRDNELRLFVIILLFVVLAVVSALILFGFVFLVGKMFFRCYECVRKRRRRRRRSCRLNIRFRISECLDALSSVRLPSWARRANYVRRTINVRRTDIVRRVSPTQPVEEPIVQNTSINSEQHNVRRANYVRANNVRRANIMRSVSSTQPVEEPVEEPIVQNTNIYSEQHSATSLPSYSSAFRMQENIIESDYSINKNSLPPAYDQLVHLIDESV